MRSKFRFAVFAALTTTLLLATSGLALEKVSARFLDDDRDMWRAATTSCSVAYYNTCTGWVWVWSGWSPSDRYGVCFTTCCTEGQSMITQTGFYCFTAAPAGYSFTGVVEVWNADAQCCPTGPAIASETLLPIDDWNIATFGGMAQNVPSTFVVTYTCGSGTGDPHAVASDHPAAGPTGPQACGYCYPNPRTAFSFWYGTPTSPLCPGSALSDGVCDSEWLWYCYVDCVTPVESTSWGRVKNFYR
jgi:hypothetical protein